MRSKIFENTPAGHESLLGWLDARGHKLEELHARIAATSQYYENLATFVHEAGVRVSVINPLQIKAFGESRLSWQKTDRAEAALTAHFAEQQSPPM